MIGGDKNPLFNKNTMDKQTIKILFLGDIVGKPGRLAVRDFLLQNRQNYDFVIANGENASHGFGLTQKNYDNLISYGINCITSGNHIWDKREIFEYINNADKLVRPFNYPDSVLGAGYRIFELSNGIKIGVINALGNVFMGYTDSPWTKIKQITEEIKKETPIVVMDFHAEATAEKICFGKYCSDAGISAFFGTHTHVPTADEKIMNNMAYITDAGYCGAIDGVIGMEYETSLNRFLTYLPERFEVAESADVQINGVEAEIDTATGYAVNIKRVYCVSNIKENEENES